MAAAEVRRLDALVSSTRGWALDPDRFPFAHSTGNGLTVSIAHAPGHIEADGGRAPEARAGRSERVFAGLLRAYPDSPARYADEMAVLFGDQLRDARMANGTPGSPSSGSGPYSISATNTLGEHLSEDGTMAQSLRDVRADADDAPPRPGRPRRCDPPALGVLLVRPVRDAGREHDPADPFALGGAAVAIAFHSRQARVARSLAS